MDKTNSPIISPIKYKLDFHPNFDEYYTEDLKEVFIGTENTMKASTISNEFYSLPSFFSLYPDSLSQNIDQIEPMLPAHDSETTKKISKQLKSSKNFNVIRSFVCAKKLIKMRYSKKLPATLTPKKEYFRVKLIRGNKRIIRHITEKKGYPQTTLNKYNIGQSHSYSELKAFVLANQFRLLLISKTYNGPLTDGVAYNKKAFGKDYKKKVNKDKTFNNGFCNNFFKDEVVKRCYFLYVDYLFENQEIETLKNKFQIRCCSSKKCECPSEKWKLLQEYCKGKLIEDPKIDSEDIETNIMDSEYLDEDF